ncbi:MAG: hypothetical protein IJH75_01220 [Mogibacterium sp.]|nr:hypothetical protein [Mogibacterium sp.]
MNTQEAREIIDQYQYSPALTEDEEFLLTEAFHFLIRETDDPEFDGFRRITT